tara:strand:- start:43756 stop:43911 length:156 start_codon:yes stop_codon:yes gene_type:complete
VNWNDLREKLPACAECATFKFAIGQRDQMVECCRNPKAIEDTTMIVGPICA